MMAIKFDVLKKQAARAVKVFKGLIIGWILVTVSLVFIFKYVNPPLTPLMILRMVEAQSAHKKENIIKTWVPLSEVSKEVIDALLFAEDRSFWTHHGFDWQGIKIAYRYNKKHKYPISYSTISMQTAKNVFLYPAQTYTRKIFEAYFTVLLEMIWGKERILEVYLNVVEMGRGAYGFEAASQQYFHQPVKSLNAEQAALLVKCLPDPHFLYSPMPAGLK
ncbi:MAG: monofunctional biosynthetic peptidoglycan transglycosylase [Verrucomicrobia bacterium]|nr:monofunctional biosynthetic peptidoglycan transglycosylase [Verrucomicrobiota bacterium]